MEVSVKRKLQHLGSKFTNATEISAQEAAYNTDIFERNLLDRYMQRHEQLESLCLVEFAAWFKFSKLNARSEQSNEEYDEPIDSMHMKKITLLHKVTKCWMGLVG